MSMRHAYSNDFASLYPNVMGSVKELEPSIMVPMGVSMVPVKIKDLEKLMEKDAVVKDYIERKPEILL